MRVSRKRKKKSGLVSFLSGILVLGATMGLAFGIALAWQGAEDSANPISAKPGDAVPQSSSASPREGATVSGTPSAPADITPLTAAPSTDADAPSPSVDEPEVKKTYRVREGYSYAVPETAEMADKSWFDDALFFGDSLSVGIPGYHVMDNAAVIAFQGINTVNINSRAVIDIAGDGNRVTMLEAALAQHPGAKKIYIMLGGNGLDYDLPTFIGGYGEFVDSVKAAYPAARIYIQSILPVTDDAHKTYPSVSNERIDEYNLAIVQMAKDKGVYFADVAVALMNDEGKLPIEASPADGMHIGTEYYLKWFDYLRKHTVE